jgi:hypothetical protein
LACASTRLIVGTSAVSLGACDCVLCPCYVQQARDAPVREHNAPHVGPKLIWHDVQGEDGIHSSRGRFKTLGREPLTSLFSWIGPWNPPDRIRLPGLLASLAGQVFRVEQRAARPLPERRSAKLRRADSICWSKVAEARNPRERGFGGNQGLLRPLGPKGGAYP